MKSFFFFLILFISIFFIHGFTSPNLIQETCKSCSLNDPNIGFDFCNDSLQQAPNIQNATSLHSLGKISIKLVEHNVTNTTSFIKILLKNKTLDPFVKECLGDCLDMYNDAKLCSKEAIFCYNSSRYLDANTQISAIMDAAYTCEDGFKEKDGVVSPLTKRNNDTFELSAISLGLMHMLQQT